MAFFDDLSKKISQAGQSAVQKTKGFTGSAKISGLISDEEKNLQNFYYELGKLYYDLHQDDCENDFADLVNSISSTVKKIEEYKQQVQDIKGVVHCEKCGAEVPANQTVCGICGATMPAQEQKPTDPNLVKCSSCGAFVNKNMRFCTSCGKPMENTSKEEVTNTEETVNEPVVNAQPEPQTQSNGESELIFCTNCGMRLEKGDQFCTICGSKVK